MNNKIRIGLIGAGNIAQNEHLPSYLKQSDAEITAICDINLKRAQDVAKKHNIKHAFADYNELIALDEVDAVSICTLNDTHAPITIAAAKAGKHILCEKPMSMNPQLAYEMTKAVKENNVIFMMGMVSRFSAESKVIKSFYDAGVFGEVYYAKAGWLRRRGTPLGWFTNLSKSGGGPVIDIGVHVIDLTWYFMGKPKPIAVSACAYNKIGDYKTKGVSRWRALDTDDIVFETEDSANGIIRFENGASMNFEVSWAINGKNTGIYSSIYGTKAGAELDPFVIYGEQESILVDSTPTVKEEDSFANEIREFLDCIKEGREPVSTADDGLQIQKILNGIYDSAKLGKEVLI
jgi:predicted dehydrogenase